MGGGGSGENAVLADEELLHAISGTDLGNVLDDFGVPVAAIASDDEKRAYETVRDSCILDVSRGRIDGGGVIPSAPSGIDRRMLVTKASL